MNTYQEKDQLLQGRCYQSRKVGNNTYLQRIGENAIALRLHNTDVVTYYADGSIVLDSGGWKTPTTKDRINMGLPGGWQVYQDKGIWYLVKGRYWDPIPPEEQRKWVFRDGITIRDGRVLRDGGSGKEELKLRGTVKNYATVFIQEMKLGNIPAPSNGDCWYCSLRTGDGKTLGDAFEDNDHIKSHLEEGYFVPSLLWNALETMGASIACKSMVAAKWGLIEKGWPEDKWLWDQAKRLLTRYLYRKLGLAS